jgi:hypothetical protein
MHLSCSEHLFGSFASTTTMVYMTYDDDVILRLLRCSSKKGSRGHTGTNLRIAKPGIAKRGTGGILLFPAGTCATILCLQPGTIIDYDYDYDYIRCPGLATVLGSID